MRLSPHYFAVLPIAISQGPCEELCDLDGPLICTNGSWARDSPFGIICHAYFRTSEVGGRCYHTETVSSCPDTLTPLTLVDVEAILAPMRAANTAGEAVGMMRDGPVGGLTRVVRRRRVVPVATFTPTMVVTTTSAEVAPIGDIESFPTGYPATAGTPAALDIDGSNTVRPTRRRRVIQISSEPQTVSTVSPFPTVHTTATPETTTSSGPLNPRRPRVMPVGARPAGTIDDSIIFPPPPGPLVRQTACVISHWIANATLANPSTAPVRRFPTLQSAADHIGSVFVSRRDWQHLAVTIASVLSQIDVPEVTSLEEANDFWERARGNSLLELAMENPNCQSIHPPTACFALMMLVGNMPLPAVADEVSLFLAQRGILAFFASNSVQLGHRLVASLESMAVPEIPRILIRQIDTRGIGLYHGYAANWLSRFPAILDNPDLVRAVLKHRLYRHTAANNMSGLRRLVSMEVARVDVLPSSTLPLSQYSPAELRIGIHSIRFIGEDAFGNGLIREWFSLMDSAINGVVFSRREESGIDEISTEFDSVPISSAVGRYLALCIVHGSRTSLNLPIGFFKLLLLQTVSVRDTAEIDAEMFNALSQFENADSEDALSGLMYGMEDDPLMGSGASEPLTLLNKADQIRAAVTNLITNHSPEVFGAISAGFFDVIPREFLRDVSPQTLRNLICGSLEPIDGTELFNIIRFRQGEYWTPERMGWFRDVLTSFSQERLRNFLRYMTGYRVLPVGGLGAVGVIGITSYSRSLQANPMAHTCFKTPDWPEYDTFEETREVLTNLADFGNISGMSEGTF